MIWSALEKLHTFEELGGPWVVRDIRSPHKCGKEIQCGNTKRGQSWSKLSVRVIAQGMSIDEGRHWEQGSWKNKKVRAKDLSWHHSKRQINQVKETPINTSWLPQVSRGARAIYREAERKDGKQGRKITAPTLVKEQRGVSHPLSAHRLPATQGRGLERCRGLMFSFVHFLTVNVCCDVPSLNACKNKSVPLSII